MIDPDQIGRLLDNAVPPLQEPADRLAKVRARVRRARLRTGSAAGLAVLVAVAVAVLPRVAFDEVAPTPVQLGAADCPRQAPAHSTRSGVEVSPPNLPEGATEAMLCVRASDGELLGYQVLDTGVERLVEGLGPQRPEAVGGSDCRPLDSGEHIWLVLRYPTDDMTAVAIDVAQDCVFFSGEVVGLRGSVSLLEHFYRLYDQQVSAAQPESIATPECPQVIGASRLDPASADFGPEPRVAERPVAPDQYENPALPYPLVAVSLCTYALDAGEARLVDTRHQRDGVDALHRGLVETFAPLSTWGSRLSCTDSAHRATNPFVIVVTDRSGGISEFWVYANPGSTCWDTIRDPYSAGLDIRPASPELVDYIDQAFDLSELNGP
jgi:hypothetical protein